MCESSIYFTNITQEKYNYCDSISSVQIHYTTLFAYNSLIIKKLFIAIQSGVFKNRTIKIALHKMSSYCSL